MSTPDNHGKKAPQFAAFKPLTTVQNANDCCCDGACSSTPTLSENVSGTRYSWKVSGMDCAACARNNHLITVALGAFSKAEQLIRRTVGGDHFDMVRNVQGIKDFCGKLHGSPVAFGPHHDGDTRRIIAGRHAS